VLGGPVRVGTENRAKLEAVRSALALFAPAGVEIRVEPVAAASGVPDQPLGWNQIMQGARNRAHAALASGEGSLGVGIEDGLVEIPSPAVAGVEAPGLSPWLNVGCAWVTDGTREARGFSSGFAYPAGALAPAVKDQAPIGDLFDAHWSRHRAVEAAERGVPSGPGGGNIGRLTGGRLTRADYGRQAVLCALVPFLHRDLYD
jgi:inosine/xanthosine triphosphatase